MKYFKLVSYMAIIGIQFLLLNQVMAEHPPTIDEQYTLEKKQRVTRTEFDFSYYVNIVNDGPAIKNVNATLTSTSSDTIVIDGSVHFNDVAPDTLSSSIDTFTIRQNRLSKFDPNSLVWTVQYELADNGGLPPDPGLEGLMTIEGIDSDNDGVRDDVQIAIAKRYPSDTDAKLALTQFATSIQHALIAKINNNDQQLNNSFLEIIAATDCITFSTPTPEEDIIFIQMIMENTDARRQTYMEINAAASGQFFGGEVDPDSACQR